MCIFSFFFLFFFANIYIYFFSVKSHSAAGKNGFTHHSPDLQGRTLNSAKKRRLNETDTRGCVLTQILEKVSEPRAAIHIHASEKYACCPENGCKAIKCFTVGVKTLFTFLRVVGRFCLLFAAFLVVAALLFRGKD